MESEKIYCPHCKSTAYTTLHASGSEYAAIISHDCGSVTLHACLNCGTVYLDQHYVKSIAQRRRKAIGKL